MVCRIKLGKEGKENQFDENVNIKQVFGEYCILLNKKMQPVVLKPTGEPLEPLETNGVYIIVGRSEEIIKQAKKQYLDLQKKKYLESIQNQAETSNPALPDTPTKHLWEEMQRQKTLRKQEKKEKKEKKKQEKKLKKQRKEKEKREREEQEISCILCWPRKPVAVELHKKRKHKHKHKKTGDPEVDDLFQQMLPEM